MAHDRNGSIARSAQVHSRMLDGMLRDPYFKLAPPKTAGREQFEKECLHDVLCVGMIREQPASFAHERRAVAFVEVHAGFNESTLVALDLRTGDVHWKARGFGKGAVLGVGDDLVALLALQAPGGDEVLVGVDEEAQQGRSPRHGIGVEDVVSQVPLSRRVLESRFEKVLGRTPHDEILR